jgi:heme exporter protein B
LLAEAAAVAAKDIRIERRSHVATNQVVPFALVVVVLFGLALDPDRGVLTRTAPGLLWVTVLLAALMAVQRGVVVETSDRAVDQLRLSGIDPGAVFLGKAGSLAVQLMVVEAVLAAGVAILYGATLASPGLLIAASVAATIGLASAGTLYGAVAAGLKVRETLVPLLVLPVVAPVLLGATRAWEAGIGLATTEGWPWVRLLAAFAAVFTAAGLLFYGPLMEEA